MSQIFRSRNDDLVVQVFGFEHKWASVVYDGPSIRGAIVCWSVGFKEVGGAGLTSVRVGLRKVVGPVTNVWHVAVLVGVGIDLVCRVGYVEILDLVAGDVLEVTGSLQPSAGYVFLVDGLTVVVL